MVILRFILSIIFWIIFTPIKWLENSLTKRKDNILEWHLNYGPSFVKIETNYKGQFLCDDLLIASYILFLAKYFYICDNKQVDVVRNFLLEEIEKSEKPNIVTVKLYELIFQTFNQRDKNIINKFLPNPPLTFSEDEEPVRSVAKYTFSVFKHSNDNGLGHILHMSFGPDILLLPLTVGILYEYVVDKLEDKGKKEKLNNLVIEMMKKHSSVDCRSIKGQNELPNEIIKDNDLKY